MNTFDLCSVTILLQILLTKLKLIEDLQKDIVNAIRWEPILSGAKIGVNVKAGVVTLIRK